MVDHVEDGAGARLRRQREGTHRDKAEVGQRGVRHQAFHVPLADGEQRPVEDPDHRQREHHGREVGRRVREQRDAVADQPEGPDLVQDAHQQDRAAGRRLRARVRQPGVEGEQRRLDGEGDEEAQEEQLLHTRGDIQLTQGGEVEGAGAELVGRDDVETDHRGEHEQPAEQAVQQELHRRVGPLRLLFDRPVAPDQEVHRDQHRLEEDVEQEDVGGGEHPDHPRLEREQQREERRDAAPAHHGSAVRGGGIDLVPGGEDDDRHQQRREQDQHQRDPVGTHRVGDAELLDPGVLLGELEAGPRRLVRDGRQQRQHELHQRDRQGDLLGQRAQPPRDDRDDGRRGGRDDQQEGQPRETVHVIRPLPAAPPQPRGQHLPTSTARRSGRTRSGCGAAARTGRRSRRRRPGPARPPRPCPARPGNG